MSSSFSPQGVEHHIVAVEAVHLPLPTITLPAPYTYRLTKYPTTTRAELPARIKDATVIICITTQLNAEVLDEAVTPQLQFIVVMGTGTNGIDLDAAKKRGIRVCNCPGSGVDCVSQHAISLYFAARRSIVKMHQAVIDGGSEWSDKGSVAYKMRDADGKPPLTSGEEVMGILGYGSLGKQIATLGRGLGMKVLVAERKSVLAPGSAELSPVRVDRTPFEQVLRKASVVIVSCPRNAETENLLSTAELAMMRPNAVVVNIARGGIVDEDAIAKALEERQIFGYATDVFLNEPLRSEADSPLVAAAKRGLNITVSPHVAWHSGLTISNLQRLLKETVEAWFSPEPKHVIV